MDEDDIDIHFFSNNLLEMEGIPKIFREIETDKPSEPEDTDKRRLIIFEVKIIALI